MAGNRGEGGRAPAGCPLLSPQQGAVKGRPPGTGRRIPASFFADILAFLGIICSFFLFFSWQILFAKVFYYTRFTLFLERAGLSPKRTALNEVSSKKFFLSFLATVMSLRQWVIVNNMQF